MDDTVARTAEPDPRTREIRRDIEHTREEMSETLDAIQEKLRPANLMSRATDRVKQATSERVRQMTRSAERAASSMMSATHDTDGLMGTLRSNAMPAALMAFGAAWWWMRSRAASSEAQYGNWVSDDEGWYTPDRQDRGSRLSTMTESASSAASGAAESAQEMTHRAREYTREATRSARRAGRRAQSELARMTRENPLAIGAGALLLGATVGLAIPETERENELLGDTRDSMLDRAQQMARTAASRAQDVATDLAGEAARRLVTGPPE
jgi:hypothetical protein